MGDEGNIPTLLRRYLDDDALYECQACYWIWNTFMTNIESFLDGCIQVLQIKEDSRLHLRVLQYISSPHFNLVATIRQWISKGGDRTLGIQLAGLIANCFAEKSLEIGLMATDALCPIVKGFSCTDDVISLFEDVLNDLKVPLQLRSIYLISVCKMESTEPSVLFNCMLAIDHILQELKDTDEFFHFLMDTVCSFFLHQPPSGKFDDETSLAFSVALFSIKYCDERVIDKGFRILYKILTTNGDLPEDVTAQILNALEEKLNSVEDSDLIPTMHFLDAVVRLREPIVMSMVYENWLAVILPRLLDLRSARCVRYDLANVFSELISVDNQFLQFLEESLGQSKLALIHYQLLFEEHNIEPIKDRFAEVVGYLVDPDLIVAEAAAEIFVKYIKRHHDYSLFLENRALIGTYLSTTSKSSIQVLGALASSGYLQLYEDAFLRQMGLTLETFLLTMKADEKMLEILQTARLITETSSSFIFDPLVILDKLMGTTDFYDTRCASNCYLLCSSIFKKLDLGMREKYVSGIKNYLLTAPFKCLSLIAYTNILEIEQEKDPSELVSILNALIEAMKTEEYDAVEHGAIGIKHLLQVYRYMFQNIDIRLISATLISSIKSLKYPIKLKAVMINTLGSVIQIGKNPQIGEIIDLTKYMRSLSTTSIESDNVSLQVIYFMAMIGLWESILAAVRNCAAFGIFKQRQSLFIEFLDDLGESGILEGETLLKKAVLDLLSGLSREVMALDSSAYLKLRYFFTYLLKFLHGTDFERGKTIFDSFEIRFSHLTSF